MLVRSSLVLAAGLATGAGIKWLDLHTVYLGDIFSQTSVWILICTALAVLSRTPRRAAVNVGLYCWGMLPTYYLTADTLGSPYSMTFVRGWALFSLCAPLLAFLTWYAGGRGVLARLLSAGILLVMLGISLVLFDKIRLWDWIFAGGVAALLSFCRKKQI